MSDAARLEVMSKHRQQDVLRAELDKLRGAISAASTGNFTVEIPDSAIEDTQLLSSDLRQMFGDLRTTIGRFASDSLIVRDRATQMARAATEVLTVAESQRGSVEKIGEATLKLKGTIDEIRKALDGATQENDNANRQAELSEVAIRQSETSIAEMLASAQRIDKIVGEIQDIAEQTNLLAINATIEAARAGEAGKGFAVVASEVKDLAKKSNTAAQNIASLIQVYLRCVDQSSKAGIDTTEQLRQIIGAVHSIQNRISEVVHSTQRQAEQTEQVDRLIQDVAASATQSCLRISQDSQQFQQIAETLSHQTRRFRV